MIIFDPNIEDQLDELIEILYKEEYFSIKESAYQYVDDLIDNIISLLLGEYHRREPLPISLVMGKT